MSSEKNDLSIDNRTRNFTANHWIGFWSNGWVYWRERRNWVLFFKFNWHLYFHAFGFIAGLNKKFDDENQIADALSKISTSRLDPVITNVSPMMKQYMSALYQQSISTRKRKKRSTLQLSNDLEMIVSLPSKINSNKIRFDYHKSLKNLFYAELIIRLESLPNSSNIELFVSSNKIKHFSSSRDGGSFWLKFDVSGNVQTFPLDVALKNNGEQIFPSAFLVLKFRRIDSHSVVRRDLSSFDDVTSHEDFIQSTNNCAVRRFHMNFAELNWTSWIVEPKSYEMNVCSGNCFKRSTKHPYSIIKRYLEQHLSTKVTEQCCQPKRFGSTTLLYYDGPNLVLKRFEKMRVLSCSCSEFNWIIPTQHVFFCF